MEPRPPHPLGHPLIEVRGLTKAFGEDPPVLTGVDLTVAEGTTTVLLGTSGSGKTVLLKHLIGLLKADQGTVRIDGEDVAALSAVELERLRLKLGIVFQGGALFDSLTVFDNVAFPLREHLHLGSAEVAERVRRTLKLVALEHVEGLYPAELSGGMRKRVAFARAIVGEPRVLLLDEPTAGLDPITTEYVVEAIRAGQRALGVTSFVITSDLRVAFALADQIALLYQGRIAACGSREQIEHSHDPVVVAFIHQYQEQVAAEHSRSTS